MRQPVVEQPDNALIARFIKAASDPALTAVDISSQLRLKGLTVVTIKAPGLLKMHFKAGALVRGVIRRVLEGDDRI